MMSYTLTNSQIASFHNDGYLIIRSFFNKEEVSRLYNVAMEDADVANHSIDLNDREGKKTKLALWFTLRNDIYGLLAKSERMIHCVSDLMDGISAVCHFHSKLMQKEPKVGGAWEWHQDYGY